MNRQDMFSAIRARGNTPWDIVVIGGGATGLGVAVDAASRGFSTLLLEQSDFAKGTSSRSTKLVHGGVRYLQQGNIKLVMEALHERGILRKNAPHLVKDQSFIVPSYKWWEGPFYGLGLKVYDWMSGRLGLGPSKLLSREETLALAPTLDAEGLRGGVIYHDGQFDDARLAMSLAMTAAKEGGVLVNYCKVTGLVKDNGKITGVEFADMDAGGGAGAGAGGDVGSGAGTPAAPSAGTGGGRRQVVRAKTVINATGVFTDDILRLDSAGSEPIIAPSQGVHIVLDKTFLPGTAAIMVPHTDDGRVLFAVPWHDKIIVGTTDTPVKHVSAEPKALPEEIEFILQQIGKYLSQPPTRADIRSVFAGLRPLVKSSGKKTAEMSRDHLISVSDSGLITVTGGKWTTYRRMAEDTVNTSIAHGGLEARPCRTVELVIHGGEAPLPTRGGQAGTARAQVQAGDGGGGSRVEDRNSFRAEDRSSSPAEHRSSSPADHRGSSPAEHRSSSPAEHRGSSRAEDRNSPPAEAGNAEIGGPLYYYGTDAPKVRALAAADASLAELLHPRLPYIRAEVVWAAREEMCLTVEDALSRRTRALLLDAAAAVECAPLVAKLLAGELGRDEAWQSAQIAAFTQLAEGYLV